nr:proline-rich protein 31 [Gorilla gorilla gorilla]
MLGTQWTLARCLLPSHADPGLAGSLRGDSSEDGRRGRLLPQSPAPCSPVWSPGTPVGGPHPAGDGPATAPGPPEGPELAFPQDLSPAWPQKGAGTHPANAGPGPLSQRSSQLRTPLEAGRKWGWKMTRWMLCRDQAPGEGTQAKLLNLCFSLLSL